MGSLIRFLESTMLRVNGQSFLEFCRKLDVLKLDTKSGRILTRGDIVDHGLTWSFYFMDPDQNRIEITSYDYEEIEGAYI